MEVDPGVVAGGNAFRAERARFVQKGLELDFPIAQHVRIGGAAGTILGQEVLENGGPVLSGKITCVEGNVQAGADGAPTATPERWEVTYGASSQPAAAVTSFEGSVGWSSGSGMEFQSTSTTQLQTYLASGSSGLMGGGPQLGTPGVSPMNSTLLPYMLN